MATTRCKHGSLLTVHNRTIDQGHAIADLRLRLETAEAGIGKLNDNMVPRELRAKVAEEAATAKLRPQPASTLEQRMVGALKAQQPTMYEDYLVKVAGICAKVAEDGR